MSGSLFDNETRPGRSSAAQRRLKLPALCAFRAQPVRLHMNTSDTPPTADPHGGWCGAGI